MQTVKNMKICKQWEYGFTIMREFLKFYARLNRNTDVLWSIPFLEMQGLKQYKW